jgi:polar amino acid transport system substrate-binding protein
MISAEMADRVHRGACIRIASPVLLALCAGCASQVDRPSAEVRAALAPNETLRVGVYPGSPTSLVRDPVSGEAKGLTIDLGRELARRLGVSFQQVEFRRVSEVLDAVNAGNVDFAISNATPARAKKVDFTQPVVALELGYLVPPNSSLQSISDADRRGIRIGVTQGSTSQTTLPGRLRQADVVPVSNVGVAREMLDRGELDAFATNKAILREMADGLPGSRVLDGNWGIEHLAIAIPKGRDSGMAYLRTFVQEARATGLVARASDRAGLRGASNARD